MCLSGIWLSLNIPSYQYIGNHIVEIRWSYDGFIPTNGIFCTSKMGTFILIQGRGIDSETVSAVCTL